MQNIRLLAIRIIYGTRTFITQKSPVMEWHDYTISTLLMRLVVNSANYFLTENFVLIYIQFVLLSLPEVNMARLHFSETLSSTKAKNQMDVFRKAFSLSGYQKPQRFSSNIKRTRQIRFSCAFRDKSKQKPVCLDHRMATER